MARVTSLLMGAAAVCGAFFPLWAQVTTVPTSITRSYVSPPVGLGSSETASITLVNVASSTAVEPAPSCTGTISFSNPNGAIGNSDALHVGAGAIYDRHLAVRERRSFRHSRRNPGHGLTHDFDFHARPPFPRVFSRNLRFGYRSNARGVEQLAGDRGAGGADCSGRHAYGRSLAVISSAIFDALNMETGCRLPCTVKSGLASISIRPQTRRSHVKRPLRWSGKHNGSHVQCGRPWPSVTRLRTP